jgi:acyl-CoA synthetase (AMP-forming)/AMP-acid ligase II
LSSNEIGRVQIRGASVVRTYLRDAAADRFDAEGWLETRDLGRFDADGDLFLVGRADDVINRGGEMVYPRDVEEVLLATPGVRAAAVIGMPDDKLGERVVAFVVAATGSSNAKPDDELLAPLQQACEQQLSRHQRPAEFRFVDELPRGSTGKTQHAKVRELASEAAT